LFGVDLPSGQESQTFIQNVTQLAKEGFDSPENAKLLHVIELNKLGFDTVTIEGGYSAWKDYKNKK
jgi:hypothetical protein